MTNESSRTGEKKVDGKVEVGVRRLPVVKVGYCLCVVIRQANVGEWSVRLRISPRARWVSGALSTFVRVDSAAHI